MPKLAYSDEVAQWIEQQTRHFDLIASWEQLCETYQQLNFTDPLSDSTKLEEFKWIIHELNKSMTRAKKALQSAQDIEGAIQYLQNALPSSEGRDISERKQVAYNKMRQQWTLNALRMMEDAKNQEEETYAGY